MVTCHLCLYCVNAPSNFVWLLGSDQLNVPSDFVGKTYDELVQHLVRTTAVLSQLAHHVRGLFRESFCDDMLRIVRLCVGCLGMQFAECCVPLGLLVAKNRALENHHPFVFTNPQKSYLLKKVRRVLSRAQCVA